MAEDRYDIPTQDSQDSDYEDDQAIDTLSLSDFMIYDNNGDPKDFYRLKNPMDYDDDDEFEFSSELLKTSVNNNTIVFCGKIIPYKETTTISEKTPRKLESKASHKQRWRFAMFFKKSSKSKSNTYSEKLDLNYQVPIRRVSILASATRPRWYLFMFGIGSSSFSAQMHIRDLKKRQTSIRNKDRKDHKKTGGNDNRVGSWRLVKLLGCGGGGGRGHGGDSHHPNAIEKLE